MRRLKNEHVDWGKPMMRLLGWMVVLAWLFAAAPAQAQYSRNSAGWTVAGSDGICLAFGPETGGQVLSFGLGGSGFFLSFRSPRLTRGGAATVDATVSIDDDWRQRVMGTFEDEDILVFEFDATDPFIAHLRSGRLLRIQSGESVYKADLTGTAAAIVTLWDCGQAVGAPPAVMARTGPDEEGFIVGGWHGRAFHDEAGTVEDCLIAGPRDGAVGLVIGRAGYGLNVAVQNDSWALSVNETYPATLSVDGGWRAEFAAVAIGLGTLRIDLSGDQVVVDRLRLGTRLTVAAIGEAYHFDLAGSSAAIGALMDCFGTAAGGTSAVAFGGRRPEPARDGVQRIVPYLSYEAFVLTVEFVLPGAPDVWETPDDALADYQFHSETEDGLYRGYYLEVAPLGESGVETIDRFMWMAETVCAGGSRSIGREVEQIGDAVVAWETIECQTPGGAAFASAVVSHTAENAQIFMIDGDAAVHAATAALYRTMRALARDG